MSQVIPDNGFVVTDGRVLPEPYHQAARTMLAHRANPSVMTTERGVFFAGACF
ncbi:MAG: hypothetical protein ACHQWV_05345 [Nitrospirales bacterium]